jgi:ribonuclease E
MQKEDMPKKMLIDATHAEETRVVVVDGNMVEEFDFEAEARRQLAGNIYLAKVTRVEPSLQAAFVDYGGNRHGFLAFSEIHPDYYQIPMADREALMEEERAYAEAMAKRDEEEDEKPKRRRSRSRSKAKAVESDDAVTTAEAPQGDQIAGMETIDLEADAEAGAQDDADAQEAGAEGEGLSPMETVAETPVEEPDSAETDATETETTAPDAPEADAASDEAQSDDAETDDAETDDTETDDVEAGSPRPGSAAARDDGIENVADDDDHEDIRPVRKPRPKRYKIQEVIKVRQILLVQVVKEERGNKGAALTTYLSLAGRYCVLMPNTARGGGISRKITNATDRKKLKAIATEIDVPTGAGLIVRTAGAKRTKTEIKRDYEYLQRLWEQIRDLTLQSIAPAKIYEEGDLIKRSIRDLYNRDIDEVLVEGERGYRNAKDFMKMIMPSHAKNVQQYTEGMPLFARYQVESYLAAMFNPTVQLKSGGYIVIGVTEALVAIDVNSGKATKEGSIEETALKTNLEAAEEVARQLRLRDLAGLIVIDFIDMDERKNNAAVEKRIKDKLKSDRARIQVGRISGFGLMEMSRQRLRPGMIEATTAPCPACHGTGLVRSDDSLALQVIRQIEEEGTRRRSREVLVKCPVGIANYLMNAKREHIALIEARYGMAVRIEGDPMLVSPDFSMEKFKTATRRVPEIAAPVVSVDTRLMAEIDEDGATEAEAEEAPAPAAAQEAPAAAPAPAAEGEEQPKKKRRRRRRRRSKSGSGETGAAETASNGADAGDTAASDGADAATQSEGETAAAAETEETGESKPKKTRSRSRSRKKSAPESETDATPAAPAEAASSDVSDVAPDVVPDSPETVDTPIVAEVVDAPLEETTVPQPEAVTDADAAVAPLEQEAPDVPEPTLSEEEVAEVPGAPADAVLDAADPAIPDTPETVETAPEDVVAPEVTEEADAPTAVDDVMHDVADTTPPQEPPAGDAPEAVEPEREVVTEPADTGPAKPKRRGWWSR